MTSKAVVAAVACALGATLAAQEEGPAVVRQVTVQAIPGVVAAGAQWTIVWQGTDNADGIVGTPDGGVIFAQEQPSRVGKVDRNGRFSVYAERTNGGGSLGLDTRGRVYAVQRTCTDPGLKTPCTEPTKVGIVYPENERKTLADSFGGKPLARPSDLVVATNGGVYFTAGGAFYIPPDGGRVIGVGQKVRANGIMLSRDEKTLYVTNGPTVVAFDVQADGSAINQREFVKLSAGNADGLAIDSEGRLYVASGTPGIHVFSAAGKHLGTIPTPREATTLAFSGPDKRVLYSVGRGALGPDGKEFVTPAGVRNNSKTLYRIPMLAQGFAGRPK